MGSGYSRHTSAAVVGPGPEASRCLMPNSHHRPPDTTKQSCLCRVRRGGVNWTVAINVTHLVTHLVWPHQPEKTHRGGLGLGGSVHEEARPCFSCFVQPSFKGIDAGSIHHPLVQLIPSINPLFEKKYSQQSRVHRNLTNFPESPLIPLLLSSRIKKLV